MNGHGNQCVRLGDFNRIGNLNSEVERIVDVARKIAWRKAQLNKDAMGIATLLTLIPDGASYGFFKNKGPHWVIQQEREGLR